MGLDYVTRVLAQEDTVLFIGSGISRWAGLPSWEQLIQELAKFVEEAGHSAELIRQEALRGDLLQAASYGFDKLTQHQIGTFIRSASRLGIAKPQEIHRLIVSLGPRCYITTNYDNLVEESLRLWHPDRYYRPPITNRHLTETAEIVHARAVDFVFKPHGDAGDSDSIILTREQYRRLLPGGDRTAALESLKMLLASRPIVYLGFGLRDPDFLYLRDLLSNTYKGGVRDHYAITADVREAEVDYWRRNYGIHLISYETSEGLNGSRDHTRLLELLNHLHTLSKETQRKTQDTKSLTADLILALARHAGRLTRFHPIKPEFPIRIRSEAPGGQSFLPFALDPFDGYTVDRFLSEGPERTLLFGLPGAGKTYALRKHAAELGERLNDACLAEHPEETNFVIPIFVDMKLYRGNLRSLIDQALPPELTFTLLQDRFKVKILIDSFNEMPREQWETGSYEADIASFLESAKDASVVITSRTADGLAGFGFRSYSLEEIDASFVEEELQRRGFMHEGILLREAIYLLKKPLYFQLYMSGNYPSEVVPHPQHLLGSYFAQLEEAFTPEVRSGFKLTHVLSLVAYDALNTGQEAQPLQSVLQIFRNQLRIAGESQINDEELANWLVSKAVMIPHTGHRIAFFHQSVTEFLAASELARRYLSGPQILQEKLTLRRWDQALFLTLMLLPPDTADTFLESVLEADFVLGMRASKYVEIDRDEVVSKLLEKLPMYIGKLDALDSGLASAIQFDLPLTSIHEPALWDLVLRGNTVGAAAAIRIADMRGPAAKPQLLKILCDRPNDYNLCCNGIAPAIKRYVDTSDLEAIVAFADSLEHQVTPSSDDDVAVGFISGSAEAIASLELSTIKETLLTESTNADVPEVKSRILCRVLEIRKSAEALQIASELLLRGVERAATAIYFIGRFSDADAGLDWCLFDTSHIDLLLAMIRQSEAIGWPIRALSCISHNRPDLKSYITARVTQSTFVDAAILYAVSSSSVEVAPVFEAFQNFIVEGPPTNLQQLTGLIREMKLEWSGHESLLIDLIKTVQDPGFTVALIDSIQSIGEIQIGPIDWWLDWLTDQQDPAAWWWLCDRISRLFSRSLPLADQDLFLSEFNRPGSKYRDVLAEWVLLQRRDLTTDHLSEEAISHLLASLRKSHGMMLLRGHLLGWAATETFVEERLLPMITERSEPLASNLRAVLRAAGKRHAKRYVSE